MPYGIPRSLIPYGQTVTKNPLLNCAIQFLDFSGFYRRSRDSEIPPTEKLNDPAVSQKI